MFKRWFIIIAALGLAGLAALLWLWHGAPSASVPQSSADSDFVLQSASGPVDTVSLRGKVVLVFFGYTFCPDICPTSLAAATEALNRLNADELAQVRLIFISVDPERDTLTHLEEYVDFFHPNMIGVTGSAEELAAVAKRYGAAYIRQDVSGAAGYVIDHSAWTYLLAPDGHMAAKLPHGAAVEQIAAEIRKYLPSTPSSKGAS
ncbi:MAG: SCO family protein [Zoogloeaceae bacterium]|jgi:protein SCO1/2|nr:SCO family protein [Zoogloeaceae bacterium]